MDEQQFEWNDSNIAHLARHAVSTDEAEQAILDPDAVVLEIQSGNEDRVKAVGMTRSGRILEVVCNGSQTDAPLVLRLFSVNGATPGDVNSDRPSGGRRV